MASADTVSISRLSLAVAMSLGLLRTLCAQDQNIGYSLITRATDERREIKNGFFEFATTFYQYERAGLKLSERKIVRKYKTWIANDSIRSDTFILQDGEVKFDPPHRELRLLNDSKYTYWHSKNSSSKLPFALTTYSAELVPEPIQFTSIDPRLIGTIPTDSANLISYTFDSLSRMATKDSVQFEDRNGRVIVKFAVNKSNISLEFNAEKQCIRVLVTYDSNGRLCSNEVISSYGGVGMRALPISWEYKRMLGDDIAEKETGTLVSTDAVPASSVFEIQSFELPAGTPVTQISRGPRAPTKYWDGERLIEKQNQRQRDPRSTTTSSYLPIILSLVTIVLLVYVITVIKSNRSKEKKHAN